MTEDEKVVLVVEEDGKQINLTDDTAAAFKSKATRNISTATAATSSSSLYSSSSSSSTAATSLAAKAIRASSAGHTNRDSSLSSAYAHSRPVSRHTSSSSSFSASISDRTAPSPPKDWDWGSHSSKPSDVEKASIRRNLNAAQQQQQQQPHGFWGNLARKAKSLLDVDEDNPLPSPPQRSQQRRHQPVPSTTTKPRYQNSNPNYESHQKKENPTLQKSLDAISSSFSYIGNAVEEGLTVVENRTAGIIKETRKHIKSKSVESTANNQGTSHRSMQQPSQRQMQIPPQMETDIELQLKASRDVRWQLYHWFLQ
uniref:Uncharacterized protein MANES_18G124700 n=1 Tax=Rhizophora mucronata TaxID=61149 RepID=A0A2P2JJT0_RHIMU